MTKLMRSCSERTSSARSFTSQRPSPRSTSGPEVSRQASARAGSGDHHADQVHAPAPGMKQRIQMMLMSG
jgi:hypothetical protein